VFRKQGVLLLGILLAILLIGQAVFGFLPSILQAVVAIPLLLIVPGYALTFAIIPGPELSKLERFLYAIGLNLAVIILGGLALYFTPWGLQKTSWALMLGVITVLVSVIGIWRRRQAPISEASLGHFHLPLRHVLLLGLAIVMIGIAFKLTLTPQSLSNIQGYTSLSIRTVSTSQPDTLLVEIHSQELEATRYILKLTYNGQLNQEWSDINLAPGKLWQQSITLPAGQGLVEAVLSLSSSPDVIYRRVSIALNK
jgi:hypothetical protein